MSDGRVREVKRAREGRRPPRKSEKNRSAGGERAHGLDRGRSEREGKF